MTISPDDSPEVAPSRKGKRWGVEDALAKSDLKPMTRLVVYDLLRRSDARTAVIPAAYSPSLASIARSTGLGKSTVKLHLNLAESGEWVTRTRNPKENSDNDPTDYAMHVPPGLRESLGQELAQAPRPGAGPDLGQETSDPRPGAGPNQTKRTRPKPDQKKDPAARRAADPYVSLPGFAEFWDVYPRKVAKRDAAKQYRTALNRCGDAQVLIKAAAAYRDDPARKPEFTAHPATWLHGDRWADEPGEPQMSASDRRVLAAREAGRRVQERLDSWPGGAQ